MAPRHLAKMDLIPCTRVIFVKKEGDTKPIRIPVPANWTSKDYQAFYSHIHAATLLGPGELSELLTQQKAKRDRAVESARAAANLANRIDEIAVARN